MVEKGVHFAEPPAWLEGFSLDLVVELDDLVRRLGTLDPSGDVRRASAEPPDRVFVSCALTDDYRAVMIGTVPGRAVLNDPDIAYLTQFGDGKSWVVWERGVTVEAVKRLCERLKRMSDDLEAIGASGTMVGDAVPLERYPVDDLFTARGAVVIPAFITAEKLAGMTDRPDDVSVVETLRGRGICRKRDLRYVELREQLVRQTLLKMVADGKLDPAHVPKRAIARAYAAAAAVLDLEYPE